MTADQRGQGAEHQEWESSRQATLELTLAATPEQRLDWLEEVLRIAYESGALRPRTDAWGRPLAPNPGPDEPERKAPPAPGG
jgi:hypothetical protein